MRVLLVGVGGTGNALGVSLAPLKMERLGLVDMDWIEVSNLSRQFLFGKADVGKMKVQVAAEKLSRVDLNIEEFCCPIQAVADSILCAYNVFILATDNIESRMHLNRRLFDLWKVDKLSEFTLVDTGSDGMRGHVQIVRPGMQLACLACSAELYVSDGEKLTNHCTVNHKPKMFAECVQMALLRTESDDFHRVHEVAQRIAEEHGIAREDIQETRTFMKGMSVNFAAVNSVISGIVTQLIMRTEMQNNLFSVNLAYGCQIEPMVVSWSENCTICRKNDVLAIELTRDSTVVDLLSKSGILEGQKTMLYSKDDHLLFDSTKDCQTTQLKDIFSNVTENHVFVMSKGKQPFWIRFHLSPVPNDR